MDFKQPDRRFFGHVGFTLRCSLSSLCFAPLRRLDLQVNTFGSGFDTILAVYSEQPSGDAGSFSILTASPRKKRPPSAQALQNEVPEVAIPTCRRPSSPRGICIRICYPGPPRLFRALDDEREWKYGGSLMFGWVPFRSTCAGISRPPPPLALLALRGSHITSMLLCTTV